MSMGRSALYMTGLFLIAFCFGAGCGTAQVSFPDFESIASVNVESTFFGAKAAVDRPLTGDQPAYDYSAHLIRDGEVLRLFSGGRWLRRGPGGGDGDHTLQHISTTGAPGTWKMPHDRPEFWQGGEEGKSDTWFANNYLEPEVIKVGDTYYMFTQVEVDPGQPIDIPGQRAETQCDRIQLHTSTDALNWQRWSEERGVIVGLDDPTRTNLHHQEVIYVPWDADGKPWWMYVAANVAGQWLGYCRMRSADPTTFDWQQRERGVWFAQLGNQTGYLRQAPGGPLFLRITFTGTDDGRTVPTFQFSRDGMKWMWGDGGPVKLAGSDDPDYPNCYFLGIETIRGTGELEYLGNNKWRAFYVATTCKTPVAPEIFHSEIGLGEVTIEITPKP